MVKEYLKFVSLIIALVIVLFFAVILKIPFKFIFVSILQGLFEWLPISSSGTVMIVAINFFGISPGEAFSLAIWLHLGTSIAVMIKFRKDFIEIFKACFPLFYGEPEEIIKKKRNWLIIATIGTAITALPLYFIFKEFLINKFTAFQGDLITLIISGLLIITGILLLKTKKIYGENDFIKITNKAVKKDSFISGLAQGISILPGISRSGITVSAILLKNYDKDTALKISFIMSVPAVFASIIIDFLFGGNNNFIFLDPLTIIILTLISFIIGYLSIEILLKLAQKVNFGYFCILYGIVTFIVILPILIFQT